MCIISVRNFHNWADKYCIKILHNLVPALRPGARVIIHERILPGLEKHDYAGCYKGNVRTLSPYLFK